MQSAVTRIFTHRAAGTVWSLIAVVLAIALAVTNEHARRKEDFLRGRIAALAAQDSTKLQGELVSCRASVRTYEAQLTAAGAEARAQPGHATPVRSARHDPDQAAAELANTSPAGFDVCARMESADRAVMKTLSRR